MDRPAFEEVIEQLKIARSCLSHGNSYDELGRPLYDVAESALDGALNVLEALNKIETPAA